MARSGKINSGRQALSRSSLSISEQRQESGLKHQGSPSCKKLWPAERTKFSSAPHSSGQQWQSQLAHRLSSHQRHNGRWKNQTFYSTLRNRIWISALKKLLHLQSRVCLMPGTQSWSKIVATVLPRCRRRTTNGNGVSLHKFNVHAPNWKTLSEAFIAGWSKDYHDLHSKKLASLPQE